jgi:hypothetical protein
VPAPKGNAAAVSAAPADAAGPETVGAAGMLSGRALPETQKAPAKTKTMSAVIFMQVP